MKNAYRAWALAALAMGLAACGGSTGNDPPPPPPAKFVDTGLLVNGDLEGDNTDRWGIYNNVAGGGLVGGDAVDCSADGFTGKCLKGTSAKWKGANVYDSGVYVNDGHKDTALVFTLTPGKTYKVTFKAKASKDAKVNVIVQGPKPDYIEPHATVLTIGTALASYESATFTPTTTQFIFAVQLGYAQNDGATLQFDDFKLLVGTDEGPPPPPPYPPAPTGYTDTTLLVNGNLEGDNTDRWGLYDNAGATNFTGGSPVDCTADGFVGKCLKASADRFIKSSGGELYDSAVYLNDGTGTSKSLFVTLARGTYLVRFKAKASQAAKAHLVMQTAGYAASLSQDINLAASLQTYVSDAFTVTAPVTLSFALQLGFVENAGATLEFDEFQLFKSDTPPSAYPPAPTGYTDTGLLVNGNLEGDNTDLWGMYDNATAPANFTGGSAVDCSADGFVGKCLKGSADVWVKSTGGQLYDSGVFLDDGTGTSHNKFVTLAPGTYMVRFVAKASQAAKAHLVMQTAGYAPSISQDIDLAAGIQTYTSNTFVVGSSVDLSFALQLGFAGNAGATLEFDEFQLFKSDAVPPPPYPPAPTGYTDTTFLVNGNLEGDNTDRWGMYGVTGGTAVDCTADGFVGKCLKGNAANFGANPWDSGVYLNNGTAGNALKMTLAPGTYLVRFKAKASQAANVKVVMQTSPGNVASLAQEIALGTSLQTYLSDPFTVTTSVELVFGVQLGYAVNNGATLEFDEFQLFKHN